MAKDYTCWDCGYYGGRHELTCPKKGYLMPSAPKAPAAPELVRVECPCGIHREDCDYHRPAPPKPYEYGAYDMAHIRFYNDTFVWFAYSLVPGDVRARIVAEVWA